MAACKTKSSACEVGYGKPPRHTQFRKGQSGNPYGRPPRDAAQRLKALTLEEAYRGVAIKEDGRMLLVTAMQAILRSQVELAAKGNIQVQRAILAAVRRFEKEDEDAATLAEIRGRIYGSESGTSTCDHEPDAEEEGDAEELNATEGMGGEAHSTSPNL
jgi:hypothetical protein